MLMWLVLVWLLLLALVLLLAVVLSPVVGVAEAAQAERKERLHPKADKEVSLSLLNPRR